MENLKENRKMKIMVKQQKTLNCSRGSHTFKQHCTFRRNINLNKHVNNSRKDKSTSLWLFNRLFSLTVDNQMIILQFSVLGYTVSTVFIIHIKPKCSVATVSLFNPTLHPPVTVSLEM